MSFYNEINDSVAAAAAKYGVTLSPDVSICDDGNIYKIYSVGGNVRADVDALTNSAELEQLGWTFNKNERTFYNSSARYETDDEELKHLEAADYADETIKKLVDSYDFDELTPGGWKWPRPGYWIERQGEIAFRLYRENDGEFIAEIVPADDEFENDWIQIILGADPLRDGWESGFGPLPDVEILDAESIARTGTDK